MIGFCCCFRCWSCFRSFYVPSGDVSIMCKDSFSAFFLWLPFNYNYLFLLFLCIMLIILREKKNCYLVSLFFPLVCLQFCKIHYNVITRLPEFLCSTERRFGNVKDVVFSLFLQRFLSIQMLWYLLFLNFPLSLWCGGTPLFGDFYGTEQYLPTDIAVLGIRSVLQNNPPHNGNPRVTHFHTKHHPSDHYHIIYFGFGSSNLPLYYMPYRR